MALFKKDDPAAAQAAAQQNTGDNSGENTADPKSNPASDPSTTDSTNPTGTTPKSSETSGTGVKAEDEFDADGADSVQGAVEHDTVEGAVMATGPVVAIDLPPAANPIPLESAPVVVQESYFAHLIAIGERMTIELKLDVLEDLEEAVGALEARAQELNTNLSGEINEIKKAHNIA